MDLPEIPEEIFSASSDLFSDLDFDSSNLEDHTSQNNDNCLIEDHTNRSGRSDLLPNTSGDVAHDESRITQAGTLMTAERLSQIKKNSCSRRNFCANVNVVLFDEATRRTSNVKGQKPKKKLNPILVDYIKCVAFQFYPFDIEQDETIEKAWRKCVISIDERNRRKTDKQ